MIPDERRKEILELLDEKGYVSVKDLSQRLYVSLLVCSLLGRQLKK